jgi:polar amino acid transport system permease protein
MRVIIPPTGNETISMLKTTSLVAAISVQDLTGAAQLIYGSNNLQIPLLVVASIWYLIMTSILSVGQYFLEKRYARGTRRMTVARPGRRLVDRMRAGRREDSTNVGGEFHG